MAISTTVLELPATQAGHVVEFVLPGIYRSARRVSGLTAYYYRTSRGVDSDLRVVWPNKLDAEVIADLDDELRSAEMELTLPAGLRLVR
jgi:hypothetical protein